MPGLGVLLCIPPAACSAHTSMMHPEESGYGMMQIIEERSMNATVHEEMEGLMVKMMEGNMTAAEQDRLLRATERRVLARYALLWLDGSRHADCDGSRRALPPGLAGGRDTGDRLARRPRREAVA